MNRYLPNIRKHRARVNRPLPYSRLNSGLSNIQVETVLSRGEEQQPTVGGPPVFASWRQREGLPFPLQGLVT